MYLEKDVFTIFTIPEADIFSVVEMSLFLVSIFLTLPCNCFCYGITGDNIMQADDFSISADGKPQNLCANANGNPAGIFSG